MYLFRFLSFKNCFKVIVHKFQKYFSYWFISLLHPEILDEIYKY